MASRLTADPSQRYVYGRVEEEAAHSAQAHQNPSTLGQTWCVGGVVLAVARILRRHRRAEKKRGLCVSRTVIITVLLLNYY